MKLDCDIVRDLLPSYVEDLVSARTKAAVEEHLAACPACRGYCDALRAPQPRTPDAVEEASLRCLKKLRRERRRTWGLVCLALLLGLLCTGGILAAGVAYNRGIYTSRSPLVSPENVRCSAVGVLPDGKLAFCLDTKIQWDHRLFYLELEDGGLRVGLTRSQEEDQQTEEVYRYWLVADLPALEEMGIDSKNIGYAGASGFWWQRGQTVEPLSAGLATVLTDALEGGEAFALPEGGAKVLTVLANIAPRAAARSNAEYFLKALYTSGWYEDILNEKTTVPQLFGSWCSPAGLKSTEYTCMMKCMIGRPGGWEGDDVAYTAQSVLLTPGSENSYDYQVELLVTGEDAQCAAATAVGTVQMDEWGSVNHFRPMYIEAVGYRLVSDTILSKHYFEEYRHMMRKAA